MRILVTGRDGQVAQALAERATGHELVFAARPAFDLAQPATIEATVARVHPELIVSAAAYTAVDKAESEPEIAMAINGDGPGMLARAAAKIGAPIIHLSTDYVFDGSLDRPWREDDATSPLGVYGATKLAGEQAVQASGADHAVIRLAWVYSPFGNNFVKTMLRLAETRDALNVVEDQQGCPSSALDIATAILAVVARWQREGATKGVYHFAGSGETNWADFARAIFAESARHGGPSAAVTGIPASDYPTPAKRPANSRLDCTRFAEGFGYHAPHWRESLSTVVARLLR
jgi:dTDP-4-dehydrorhamnose reductase